MRQQLIHLTALTLVATVLLVLSSCTSTPQSPPAVGAANITYSKGVPGGVLVQTVKITATVVSINPAERKAILQGADGKNFTVTVGQGAINFDQIRAGDRITTALTQKVVVSFGAPETPSAGESQLTAQVIAIDSAKRLAVLHFENGTTETVHVRDDLDLSQHKVGEQLVFRVTEMTVTSVEKTP